MAASIGKVGLFSFLGVIAILLFFPFIESETFQNAVCNVSNGTAMTECDEIRDTVTLSGKNRTNILVNSTNDTITLADDYQIKSGQAVVTQGTCKTVNYNKEFPQPPNVVATLVGSSNVTVQVQSITNSSHDVCIKDVVGAANDEDVSWMATDSGN